MITTTTTHHPESTRTRRPEAEPIRPRTNAERHHARRLSLIDRVALALGVALVTWSRRPRIADRRDELERLVIRRRADEQRAHEQLRLMLSCLPPR